MNHHLLFVVHLLAAAVWVGGHLYISLCVLPKALYNKSATQLIQFERTYEPLGMTALVLLVVTGIWMTLQLGISWNHWFSFSSPIEKVTSTKLLLLLTTILLAISAQTRVIPHLRTDTKKLYEMAVHIILVTITGILMLVLGSFVRYGGI